MHMLYNQHINVKITYCLVRYFSATLLVKVKFSFFFVFHFFERKSLYYILSLLCMCENIISKLIHNKLVYVVYTLPNHKKRKTFTVILYSMLKGDGKFFVEIYIRADDDGIHKIYT